LNRPARGAIGVWLGRNRVVPIPLNLSCALFLAASARGVSLRSVGAANRWNDQPLLIAQPARLPNPGMVILPASMGTVGRFASGVATDLSERVPSPPQGRPAAWCCAAISVNLNSSAQSDRPGEAGARDRPTDPAGITRPTNLEKRWWIFWSYGCFDSFLGL